MLGPVLGPSLAWLLHLHSSLETHVGDVCSCFTLDTVDFGELKQPTVKSQLETRTGDSIPELASSTLGLHLQSCEARFQSWKPEPVWAHVHVCVCVHVCACVHVCIYTSLLLRAALLTLDSQGLFKTQVAGLTLEFLMWHVLGGA